MAGASFALRIPDEGGVKRAVVGHFRTKIRDFSPATKAISLFLVDEMQGNLDRGQTAEGQAFFRLEPDYARSKAKRWGSRPILTASGDMHGSIRPAHDAREASAGPAGTGAVKARYHAALGARDVQPLRDFISGNEEKVGHIAESLVGDHLMGGL